MLIPPRMPDEPTQIEQMPGYWQSAQQQIEAQVPQATAQPRATLQPPTVDEEHIPTMAEIAQNAGRRPVSPEPGSGGMRMPGDMRSGSQTQAAAATPQITAAASGASMPGGISAAPATGPAPPAAAAPPAPVGGGVTDGRGTGVESSTVNVNAADEMTLDEAAALPVAEASTRLQFSKNKPLRSNYEEVHAGDPIAAVKKHLPASADSMPRLAGDQLGDEAAAVAAIEQILTAAPVVTDAQGKRVLLANPERGSLTARARHLAASHAVEDRFKKGPRIYKPGKAASAAAVPKTVQDYHLKAEDKSTGTILYLRRYKDGVHAVLTDNQGTVSDFGEVDSSLLIQRTTDGRDAFQRFVVKDKRTPGMAPSLDRARVPQTQEPAQQQLPRIQPSAPPAKVKTTTQQDVDAAHQRNAQLRNCATAQRATAHRAGAAAREHAAAVQRRKGCKADFVSRKHHRCSSWQTTCGCECRV